MDSLNRRWFGDRLWYLINLDTPVLRAVFHDYTPDTLKTKRKKYRKLIREGAEPEPSCPVDYKVSDTPEEIRARLDQLEKSNTKEYVEKVVSDDKQLKYLHDLLDKTVKEQGINPEHIQKFRVTVGEHTGYIKNSDNEIEYTEPLKRGGIQFFVEPERFKPKWNPIHKATGIINPVKATPTAKDKKVKTCVVLPDPQIGYRRFADTSNDPFHDENAISVALQIVADVKPDKVVLLGDVLDLPTFGRYEQTEDYAHTTQTAINYAYKFLAQIRATVPNAEIVVLEGNHDRRIENNIRTNSMFAFNLRRADDTTGWPVFSIPYLLSFDTLNISYVEGYPAGRYWITKKLQCIHGHIVRQAGVTAAAVVRSETVSTLFGHIHRIETAYDTQNVYGGARANLAHSPGCLCRIDGGVPSVKGSTGLDGRPITNYENWQQGMAIVDYQESDGSFSLHSIYINTHQNYKTTYNNKLYKPSKKIINDLNSVLKIK